MLIVLLSDSAVHRDVFVEDWWRRILPRHFMESITTSGAKEAKGALRFQTRAPMVDLMEIGPLNKSCIARGPVDVFALRLFRLHLLPLGLFLGTSVLELRSFQVRSGILYLDTCRKDPSRLSGIVVGGQSGFQLESSRVRDPRVTRRYKLSPILSCNVRPMQK